MAGAECEGGMERYCKMKERNYSLLPGELKDCLLHCGFCKKQDLSKTLRKEKKTTFINVLTVENLIEEYMKGKQKENIIYRFEKENGKII